MAMARADPKTTAGNFSTIFLNCLIKKKGAAQDLDRPGACNEKNAMTQRKIEASCDPDKQYDALMWNVASYAGPERLPYW